MKLEIESADQNQSKDPADLLEYDPNFTAVDEGKNENSETLEKSPDVISDKESGGKWI